MHNAVVSGNRYRGTTPVSRQSLNFTSAFSQKPERIVRLRQLRLAPGALRTRAKACEIAVSKCGIFQSDGQRVHGTERETFLMFDVGFWELLLIFGMGLMILGPERMPRGAAQIGRWIGRAQRTANQFRRKLQRELGWKT